MTNEKRETVICTDKDGRSYEVETSQLIFRPSVYGVLIKEGNILLVRQWDGFDFPGGGMDLGETIEEALIREIKEETGLLTRKGELVTCENSFYKSEKGDYYHSLLLYYSCEVVGGELSIDGIDENEKAYVSDLPRWIPIDQLNDVKFYNSVESLPIIAKAQKLLGSP